MLRLGAGEPSAGPVAAGRRKPGVGSHSASSLGDSTSLGLSFLQCAEGVNPAALLQRLWVREAVGAGLGATIPHPHVF